MVRFLNYSAQCKVKAFKAIARPKVGCLEVERTLFYGFHIEISDSIRDRLDAL